MKPSIQITKTIPDIKNVLVWLNYPWETGQNRPNRVLIEQALNEAGVSYHIVLAKREFEAELRNPSYTDFLILGDHHPTEDHFAEELREQVYSGKGIICSLFNRQNLDGEVFGIKFTGYLSGLDYPVEIVESEIARQGTFQSSGRALRILALHPDENIGWIVAVAKKTTTKYPGIIKGQFGDGKILFFAFDLGLSSQNYSPFSTLLRNSLSYIHNLADGTGFYPGQLIPVEIRLKSLGSAFDLSITETYPLGIEIYYPSTREWIADNPWMINLRLEANETKTIFYYVLTPDSPGTYALQTEVGYMDNGAYNFYQSVTTDIVVEKDTTAIGNDIISALGGLPVSGQEKSKIHNAVGYIHNVQNRVINSEMDIERNIDDLLKAIDSILTVTSVDISAIRLMMDYLLKTWEGRWYF